MSICAVSFADPFVVPTNLATAAGNLAVALKQKASRFQEVIGTGQFSQFTGPITITGIRIRSAPGTGPVNFISPSFKMTLSTTQAFPNTLGNHSLPSSTYADNVGPDATIVYNGPISASSPGCSAPGPCPLDMGITFSTPFTYDPSKGRLLVDYVAAAPTSAQAGSLDGVIYPDTTSSVVAVVTGDPTQSSGTLTIGGFVLGLDIAGGSGFTCANTAPVTITSIESASAYGGYNYFASGSWLEIKGNNLADPNDPRLSNASHSGQWSSADFNGSNAPTNLDGISVSINGKPAYVWYLSPTQLNVQAPEDAATGNVSISVTNCKATSSISMLSRQTLAPGLLAPSNYSSGGTQYLVATFASDGAYVLNTALGAGFGLNSRPAKPGDLIIAYGVGFGDVTPSILPGTVVSQSNQLVNPVTFSFGSTPAQLSYAGLAGSFVGLYEFYITVPAGLSNGDYQIHIAQNGTPLPQTVFLTVHN
ncbi:MAG TPA: IPT/TIG domain-containing protein [Bryobacteraceae bacterium]|nr:IPT/TIG domain-containing protein [Bryobacteraceae bacterium]